MKKALLVDTNFAAGPIFRALQKLEYRVVTVGARERDPLAMANKDYYHLDYSNVAELESLARRLDIDVIVPGCNDLSYAVCNEVAHRLGLPGFESPSAVSALHSKKLFRDLCGTLSIPAPKRYDSVEAAANSGGQIIVKPTDAFSGRGVEVLTAPDAQTLQQAMERSRGHSVSGTVLLEEYVEGDLYSYTAFLNEGEVVGAFHVAEFGSVNPFVVDTSFLVPAPKIERELLWSTKMMAQELDIRSGLMHIQYIARDESFWIIEPTRRCPGDLYSLLIEYSTGYPYAEAYICSFLERLVPPIDALKTRPTVRHTVTARNSGTFEALSIDTDVAITAWIPLATVGEALNPSPDGRVGVAFFSPEDELARDALVQNLLAGTAFRLTYA
ncbi:hypothetical protein PQZ11_00980 [Luminiphilus sp.]|nr:hypothetical protein [Luminiphilus sp.]